MSTLLGELPARKEAVNRFAGMARRDPGRFATSVSTQPGPVPAADDEDHDEDFDAKATRLAAGAARRPGGGFPPAEPIPSTADGPPRVTKPRRHRGTITAPPSSSEPDGYPESADVPSSRPAPVPPFVAPLGPFEARLEALLQWCLSGWTAPGLRGGAVADHDGLPVALVPPPAGSVPIEPSWAPLVAGALEAAVQALTASGTIKEGQIAFERDEGSRWAAAWVPAVAGRRWFLLLWGRDVPTGVPWAAMIDAFREVCRRGRHERGVGTS
ncbi:MAG: hypothetical protein AAF928_17450 [Myxococcota bacterium]